MVFQRSSYLAAEGFIMQRTSGQGIVFAEFDGYVMEYDLNPGQQIVVDTGQLAADAAVKCGKDAAALPAKRR